MNLNKSDILMILSQLPFSKDSFWVVMGGAMVLHGIRDTTQDIDIGCTNQLFEYLKNDDYSVCFSRSGLERIDYTDIIHIYKEWPADSIGFINNIPVVSLESIIKDKQTIGRLKDLVDIELIKKAMKEV